MSVSSASIGEVAANPWSRYSRASPDGRLPGTHDRSVQAGDHLGEVAGIRGPVVHEADGVADAGEALDDLRRDLVRLPHHGDRLDQLVVDGSGHVLPPVLAREASQL